MMNDSPANRIAENLQAAVAENGHASLIVSGGSSPLPVFAALSQMALPWAQVVITLVDDRLVGDEEAASNVKLVREHLLQDKAAEARFLSLKDMDDEASALTRPFDVMLLGMGTDGHFASLFPDMPDPALAFDPEAHPQLLRTPPRGNPLLPRISMNLAMILQSQHIYLMITGAEKQAVFEAAKTDAKLPIHHLIQQQKTAFQII